MYDDSQKKFLFVLHLKIKKKRTINSQIDLNKIKYQEPSTHSYKKKNIIRSIKMSIFATL